MFFIASRDSFFERAGRLCVGLTTCHMHVRLRRMHPSLHYGRDALAIGYRNKRPVPGISPRIIVQKSAPAVMHWDRRHRLGSNRLLGLGNRDTSEAHAIAFFLLHRFDVVV